MITETILVAIIIGLVQIFKGMNIVQTKYFPLVSISIAYLVTFFGSPVIDFTQFGGLTGLVYGLGASGLFDLGTIGKRK